MKGKVSKTGSSWKYGISIQIDSKNSTKKCVSLTLRRKLTKKELFIFFKMIVLVQYYCSFEKGSKLHWVRVSEEALATFDFANVIFHLQVIKATWKRSIYCERGKKRGLTRKKISSESSKGSAWNFWADWLKSLHF